jgi:hypothetical protein
MGQMNRRTGAIKLHGAKTEHLMTLGLAGVLLVFTTYMFGGPGELLFWVNRTLASVWDGLAYWWSQL